MINHDGLTYNKLEYYDESTEQTSHRLIDDKLMKLSLYLKSIDVDKGNSEYPQIPSALENKDIDKNSNNFINKCNK